MHIIHHDGGKCKYFKNFSVFCGVTAPCGCQPEQSGDHQYADGHCTGNGHCLHAFYGELSHVAADCVAHGVVNAAAGQQGEYGNNKVGYGGIFTHTGHDLRKERGNGAGDKISHIFACTQHGAQGVNSPG